MPYSFKVVNKASANISNLEKRYVYTTPKSFLELIKLFKIMFNRTKSEIEKNKENYEMGVIKLKETGKVVSKLEEDLKIKQVEVEEKKKVSDVHADIVGVEKAKVEIENQKAIIETQNCAEIQKNVDKKLTSVQKDLDEALPLVEKVQDALGMLVMELGSRFQEMKYEMMEITLMEMAESRSILVWDRNLPVPFGSVPTPFLHALENRASSFWN